MSAANFVGLNLINSQGLNYFLDFPWKHTMFFMDNNKY